MSSSFSVSDQTLSSFLAGNMPPYTQTQAEDILFGQQSVYTSWLNSLPERSDGHIITTTNGSHNVGGDGQVIAVDISVAPYFMGRTGSFVRNYSPIPLEDQQTAESNKDAEKLEPVEDQEEGYPSLEDVERVVQQ